MESRTSFYMTWVRLKQRCLNPNNPSYKDYGGRGITVCDRWIQYKNFKKDMFMTYQKGLSIDRIDNEEGYYPTNCRWATRKTQNNNTRKNRFLTYADKTMTLSQWAEHLGIKRSTLAQRFYVYGWNLDRCFNI